MVRFSCFNAHIHSHNSKKTIPPSMEAMHKSLQDCSQIKCLRNSAESTLIINNDRNVTSSSSIEHGWKSEEMLNKSNLEIDVVIKQTGCLKKSQSLGSGLYREGKNSCNSADDETDQMLSCDKSHDQNGLAVQGCSKNHDVNQLSRYQENLPSESLQERSDLMNNESIFSIGDPQHLEKECHENFDTPLIDDCAGNSGDHSPRTLPFSIGDPQHLEKECHESFDTPLFDDCAGNSGDHSPRTLPAIVKSCSMPNFRHHTPISGKCSPFMNSAPRSRSSEDVHVLEMRRKEDKIHEVRMEVMQAQGRYDGMCKSDKTNVENPGDEAYDSYNYVGSAKDWIMPNLDEVRMGKNLQGESSVLRWQELPNKDFKIKRIENWVIDLQHCSSLEETDEPSFANDQVKRGSNGSSDLTTAKLDAKATPGMEAAKRYISSLSATATTAQLVNHGLVVVPFLCAFVSLRVLNLSGNAIVRITAGALPRGLHMLNLSKNNISTIEGLRELTRLRILDLSYNRIFRIGHGLASCSSLKELYLAGNKISEVEGLHRLLKLNVLDLRFNKISTAKCLGQLAANYNSLQGISLEGNPAQKNVGDEQLKKYLQGLLTQLVYYNRQPIKVSTLKDGADRSVRLGVGAHQFDRGLRSELKPARKASHGVAAHKPSSSSTHARKGQAVVSPKLSRGRHARLPPSGTKATTNHQHHYFDIGSKLLSLRQDLSIRKSRSEGTLGAL